MTDITTSIAAPTPIPTPVVTVPPPVPATVVLDPATTLLTIPQLRDAVLAESEIDLTYEDIDTLGLVTHYTHGTDSFEVGGYIPGTAPGTKRKVRQADGSEAEVDLPQTEQQYIFAIMVGNATDLNESHVVGDVRVYAVPGLATNAKARAWVRYTLNRAAPGVILVHKMNQAGFVEQMSNEWTELYNLAAGGDEETS